jgi:hypothetical protein
MLRIHEGRTPMRIESASLVLALALGCSSAPTPKPGPNDPTPHNPKLGSSGNTSSDGCLSGKQDYTSVTPNHDDPSCPMLTPSDIPTSTSDGCTTMTYPGVQDICSILIVCKNSGTVISAGIDLTVTKSSSTFTGSLVGTFPLPLGTTGGPMNVVCTYDLSGNIQPRVSRSSLLAKNRSTFVSTTLLSCGGTCTYGDQAPSHEYSPQTDKGTIRPSIGGSAAGQSAYRRVNGALGNTRRHEDI